jgi:uncharacterized protein (PEP-CTERM system associated)
MHTRPLILLAAMGTAISWVGPGNAQTVLPETGTTTNIGDLRQQLEGIYGREAGSSATSRGWTVVPSIGLQEQWTDDGISQSGKRQSSFITAVQPGLLVNADTDRVKGTLNYAPSGYIYSNASGQNRFDNNFDGNARVTLLPEHVFLDLQGYGAVQAIRGGTSPNNVSTLSRQDSTQSYSFSAAPYARNKFGDIGTAEVGAAVAYTSQSSLGNLNFAPQNANQNQNLTSTTEHVAFVSGPALGRMVVNALGSAMQMNGTGVLRNAYRNIATVELGYAVTRSFTILATGGYENIRYNTLPPFRVDDAIWQVGARWTPNPDSSMTLHYGHKDGFDSAKFDGSYAVTARLRLYGRYSEGVSTGLESLQSAVASSVLDPLGNPVDPVTGAPLVLSDNFFGVQSSNVLYHTKVGSLTATLLFDRDAVSVGVAYQSQKPVGVTPSALLLVSPNVASINASSFTTESTYGSISWQHELTPDLRSNAYFQYGTPGNNRTLGNGTFSNRQNSGSVAASVSLIYSFSQTLTGMAQYTYTNQGSLGQNSSTSLVIIGARKTF